jgi:hypothetical protein
LGSLLFDDPGKSGDQCSFIAVGNQAVPDFFLVRFRVKWPEDSVTGHGLGSGRQVLDDEILCHAPAILVPINHEDGDLLQRPTPVLRIPPDIPQRRPAAGD